MFVVLYWVSKYFIFYNTKNKISAGLERGETCPTGLGRGKHARVG